MGRVLVTGSSRGIGREVALLFLKHGYCVTGIDICPSTIDSSEFARYNHAIADISKKEELPDLHDVEILVNCAASYTGEAFAENNISEDVQVNLIGLMNCTEKYCFGESLQERKLKSVVNFSSASAHNGAEFGAYVASKSGVLGYTMWTAKQLAPYGVTVNSLSFGGVSTDINGPVMNCPQYWYRILGETPMSKWATPEEAAEWVYFISVVNKSCTGQDIIIDNGEMINHEFVWGN